MRKIKLVLTDNTGLAPDTPLVLDNLDDYDGAIISPEPHYVDEFLALTASLYNMLGFVNKLTIGIEKSDSDTEYYTIDPTADELIIRTPVVKEVTTPEYATTTGVSWWDNMNCSRN